MTGWTYLHTSLEVDTGCKITVRLLERQVVVRVSEEASATLSVRLLTADCARALAQAFAEIADDMDYEARRLEVAS